MFAMLQRAREERCTRAMCESFPSLLSVTVCERRKTQQGPRVSVLQLLTSSQISSIAGGKSECGGIVEATAGIRGCENQIVEEQQSRIEGFSQRGLNDLTQL
jgi:hypothetical protein